MGVVSEAIWNLIATGAEPIAVVDHLQFGNPNNPEVYWTFRETVRAIATYLKEVRIPCVGGKVSFYNQDETTNRPIKPSPVIAAIGIRERKTPWMSQNLQNERDDLIIVGTTRDELGGSEYYEHGLDHIGGRVPRVNLKAETRSQKTILRILRLGLATSAHDCSKGGLAVALAEMAIQGEKGFVVDCDKIPQAATRQDQLLFSETRSRLILETSPRKTSRVLSVLKRSRIPAAKIGEVQGKDLSFVRGENTLRVSMPSAREAWCNSLSRAMEAIP